MQAKTIDEVIRELDAVIEEARRDRSRLGYFAALYRKVTASVADGIRDGFFEDGERMERLDVVFANRYLAALAAARGGDRPTQSWQVSFEAARRWPPIVLQHLLLGMNAHINLDLGIAAARTCPGAEIDALREDFHRINAVLARLVDDVKRDLTSIWPALGLLDRLPGASEEVIIDFSMARARDRAWECARKLAPLSLDQQEPHIDALDLRVAALGTLLWKPPPVTRIATWIIRLRERGSVPEIIDILG